MESTEQIQYPRFKPTTLPLAALKGAILGLIAGAIWAFILGGRLLELMGLQSEKTWSSMFSEFRPRGSWIDPDWGSAFMDWFAHIASNLLHPFPAAWDYVVHAIPIMQSAFDSWNSGISTHAAWATWTLENQHLAFSIVIRGAFYGALASTFFSAVRWVPSFFGIDFMDRTAAEYRAINLSTTRLWRFIRGLFGVAVSVMCVALFDTWALGGSLYLFFYALSFMTVTLFVVFWIFYPTAWARAVKIFGFPIYFPMHIFSSMIDNQDKNILKLLNLLVYGHTGESDKPNVEHLRGAAVLSGDELAKMIRKQSQ